ncbi:MAG TPA: hypothetical protein PLF37_07325 [Planctomycetota bacterium]|nr:hypothetical protein [Planctomycetota bacterium]
MLAIEAGDVVGLIAKTVSIAAGVVLALYLMRRFSRTPREVEQGQEAEKK